MKSRKRKTARLFRPDNSACFSIEDSSVLDIPAELLITSPSSDATSLSARLANQFISVNLGILRDFTVSASVAYDGSRVRLVLQSGIQIGALPLLSPTSGRPDYGLVIRPRFSWKGLGNILAQTGWRIVPSLVDLPLLPQSDREIPPWLLSGTVLFRLEALLKKLDRKFTLRQSDLPAPRGQVEWDTYAVKRMSNMRFLEVPCRFPDLEDHKDLKGAIHFTLRKQLASLETQLHAGIVVAKLIELCRSLLSKVRSAPEIAPTALQLTSWSKSRLNRDVFRSGLQAIEWTMEDRGLAGLSDLHGLPWVMSMDAFYESWVETILKVMTLKNGGVLKVGRKRETITPIVWDKAFVGSQKYLLPDFVIEGPSGLIVVDAKYKDHWEDLQLSSWYQLEEQIREGHRKDLHQILAYSALFDKSNITACLVYPCKEATWKSLKERDRLSHHASIHAGSRRIDLVLTTFPLSRTAEEIALALGAKIMQQKAA